MKILWMIVLILVSLSGFKIKINSNNQFEWIGILEQIYNCIIQKRIKQ